MGNTEFWFYLNVLHHKEHIIDKPAEFYLFIFLSLFENFVFRDSLSCYTLFGMGDICLILPLSPRLVLNKLVEPHYSKLSGE